MTLIQYYAESQKAMIDWMVTHPQLTIMCYIICALFICTVIMAIFKNEEAKKTIKDFVNKIL